MLKIFFCLLIAAPAFAQLQMHNMNMNHEQHTSKNIFVAQMDTMMTYMDTVKQTKKTDVDFLQLMIPHHRGAVEMSVYEVAHGKNNEMIQLAKSIIAEQQIEIQMMKGLLSFLPSLLIPKILYTARLLVLPWSFGQLLLARSLEAMALTANIANDKEGATKYRQLATDLKSKIFSNYWKESKQALVHSRVGCGIS